MKSIHLQKINLKAIIAVSSLLLVSLLSVAAYCIFLNGHDSVIKKPDLFKIKENGKWGFINKKGELVIPAEYDLAYDMYDGVAR